MTIWQYHHSDGNDHSRKKLGHWPLKSELQNWGPCRGPWNPGMALEQSIRAALWAKLVFKFTCQRKLMLQLESGSSRIAVATWLGNSASLLRFETRSSAKSSLRSWQGPRKFNGLEGVHPDPSFPSLSAKFPLLHESGRTAAPCHLCHSILEILDAKLLRRGLETTVCED